MRRQVLKWFVGAVLVFLALALVVAFPPFLLLFLIGGVALYVYAAGRRRERQTALMWHLALAVRHERSLPDELRDFADHSRGAHARRLLDVADFLAEGDTLSEAFARRRGLVPSSALTAARVGERTGRLAEALQSAASGLNREPVFRMPGVASLASLLLYATLLLTVATSVLGFVMYYIIPKFKRIFEGFDLELPEITRSVIAASDFLVNYFYLFSPLGWIPYGLLALYAVGYYWGWGELDIGFGSRWTTRFDTPNVLRDLARGIDAGQPLADTLDAIADSHRRAHVRKRLDRVADLTDAGEDPWEALRRHRFLSAAEVDLLQSAQALGNLPWTMRELADACERRWNVRAASLSFVLEPLLVLSIGAMVCVLCVAFFVPLVKMITDLS